MNETGAGVANKTARRVMLGKLRLTAGLTAFGLMGVLSATAAVQSRETTFFFLCDGSNKTVNISVSGFPGDSNQNILGAEITLLDNRGGLQYIILRAQGDPAKQILSLGSADTRAQIIMPGYTFIPAPGPGNSSAFFPVTTNIVGNVPLTIDAACNGGPGFFRGTVTVWFVN